MNEVRWTVWLVVAACSSGAGPTTRPTGPVGTGSGDGGVPVVTAPTEVECAALVDHAVELGAAERARRPADQQSTEADQKQLKVRLRPFIDCLLYTSDAADE